ncbi:MAG: rhodanese-like domain-containing protein [Flavobacteriales bacterium]|jgi:rhodanese-related sulfurtransferase|nr:rhodanese-like domain-containing protein [Flavobacteriales bacterium]
MKTLFLLFSAVLFIQCGSSEQKDLPNGAKAADISVEQFAAQMNAENAIILDVRTPEEVAKGKIAGALEMDFYSDDFNEQIATLDKNKAVYVYCASGGRSGKTMSRMSDMGFMEVYNLKGGMGAWLGANMPVEK